jgi:hypothetical protein
MTDWANLPPLEPGRALFQASDNSLHSVPSEFLWQAREIDAGLIVLARSPEEWQAFVKEQLGIDQQWNLRQESTVADRRMLAAMGIAWDDPYSCRTSTISPSA